MHLCWSHETLKKADWRTAARVNLCFISQLVCAISDLNRLLEYIHYEGETSPQCLRRDRWIMTDPMQKKKKNIQNSSTADYYRMAQGQVSIPTFPFRLHLYISVYILRVKKKNVQFTTHSSVYILYPSPVYCHLKYKY